MKRKYTEEELKGRLAQIHRHGKFIRLGDGVTAREGRDGGLPALTISENGKVHHHYRGTSLYFGDFLTEEDKRYLHSLAFE